MDFFQNIAKKYAYTGIPASDIPVIDPFQLSNITLSILGLVDLTLVTGEAVGIGKCTITKFTTNVPERYREPEMICSNITIQGHYKLSLAPIIGENCHWCHINGEGNGTIELDDWFFKFRYPFKIVRREDNQIYLDAMFDNAKYVAHVKKVTVTAESIKDGKHDITSEIVSFINNNWRLLWHSYIGKFINDKSADYYYEVYKAFFDSSPANTFLKDDLTALLDN